MNRLTPTDLDLLSAAFRRDVAAIDAFRRWSRDMDWDGPIDGDVVDLLPTVHRNVRSLGHDDGVGQGLAHLA